MIDKQKFADVLKRYKANFYSRWDEEKYKWQAVKRFQDVWKSFDLNFKDKFMKATEIHCNLLSTGAYWQPRSMIGHFFDVCGEENIKEQFHMLYDETIDLKHRITSFIDYYASEDKIGMVSEQAGKVLKTNQDPRSVSVYLASMYPSKYYFYMPSIYDKTNDFFNFKQPKGFSPIDKMLKYFEFCDEICKYIKSDTELSDMLNKVITANEYNDKDMHVLVQDILFYYLEESKEQYADRNSWLLTWNPSKWDWKDFDETVRTTKSGMACCIGRSCSNTNIEIGDRIFMMKLGEKPRGIFATGYIVSESWEDDNYDDKKTSKLRYVDILLTKVIDYQNDKILLQDDLKALFPKQHWSPQNSGIKIKGDIVHNLIEKWESLFSEANTITPDYNPDIVPYSKSDFLSEVYMSEENLNRINYMLKTKKNIILQGAPGVGKTYAAKRIAYQFMGEKNEDRICCVQFHQSYCYEDFISGYKPNGTGFELRTGAFYNFCGKAKSNPKKPYFFIIDEINRGNISKIFGELLMLIEADKRNQEITISDGTKFSIPDNLCIIGMMNTADRSLAMIDYALRRRFSFVTFKPAFDNDSFKAKVKSLENNRLNKLTEVISQLNEEIKNDVSLGNGFMIGHSYFCINNNDTTDIDLYLKNVVEYEIIPLLEEYWFDNADKITEWRKKLTEAVNS